jgi:uncharacterized protein (TIGR02391 family)
MKLLISERNDIMPEIIRVFTRAQIESVSKIIGDQVTGSIITGLLGDLKLVDDDTTGTKWKRIFNALVTHQNKHQVGNMTVMFIRRALEPARYVGKSEEFHSILESINQIISFNGIEYREDGKLHRVKPAETLSEAESRAVKFREELVRRNVHPQILEYCKAELVEDNYFHAVLEATKGIATYIRKITSLESDGASLIDEAFSVSSPLIRINDLSTESKKSEQKGFINLAKGLFGTFRNPTAHAARIEWNMSKDDALDLFVLASYIIRRIDNRHL